MIEDDLNNEQLRSMQNQNLYSMNQQEMIMQEQEKGMIKEQLDLSEELERIEHLLRGHTLKYNKEKGTTNWEEPESNDMVVLSEYGIHLVLNTITWYINKNTLLSNYDDETILTKMEDFATDLADTIFIEYEKIFQYPSFKDCEKVLNERINYKAKVKELAFKNIGINKSIQIIEKELMDEMEGRVEFEINKIKEQIVKNKLKRFLILMRVIQDAVHSTYNRAYKGMERKTLREHFHITENIQGGSPNYPQQRGGSSWNPLNWFNNKK